MARPDNITPERSLLGQWLGGDHTDSASTRLPDDAEADRIDWIRIIPFILLHAGCLGVIWVGWSPVAIGVAVGAYLVRMFAVTGFYHRYFSHRTFRTSRAGQFLFAVLGSTAVQRGPLWWAAHHRDHHRYSDTEEDPHSPVHNSFMWSHMWWITTKKNFPTKMARVKDLARFPELCFLDRYDALVPVAYAAFSLFLGEALSGYGTSGAQMLVWGFFISTIALFHGTCTINSLAHLIGRRRYDTDDESRNSLLLSLLTLGEGWHNNHHHYPGTVRQGFFWWEIDITFYVLKMLSWTGLVWDLRPVPEEAKSP